MKYEEMFNEYKKYVGISDEDIAKYIDENNIDENDGIHIWFEFVVTPIVLDAIKNNNSNLIAKSFEFVENVLKTDDRDITEVIEFSLLEGIVSELGEKINEIDLYFGAETSKSIGAIKKIYFFLRNNKKTIVSNPSCPPT